MFMMGGGEEEIAQTVRFLPELLSISSDDINLVDTLCSVMDRPHIFLD